MKEHWNEYLTIRLAISGDYWLRAKTLLVTKKTGGFHDSDSGSIEQNHISYYDVYIQF